MTRVIRADGSNVSPSDDGKLFTKIFATGLFNSPTITSLGANQIHIPTIYGIACGRDFQIDAYDSTVNLPASSTVSGMIILKLDFSTTDIVSIYSKISSTYELVQEDVNETGSVYEILLAKYSASSTAVTSITMCYPIASVTTSGGSVETAYTITASSWSSGTTSQGGNAYYYYDISLTKIYDEHPDIMIRSTSSSDPIPTTAQQTAFNLVKYAYVDATNLRLRLLAESVPSTSFGIIVKGVA